YVHRIGRTGRAGAEGTALSFACDDYVFSLDAIEKLIGRKIPEEWPAEGLFRAGKVASAPKASVFRRPPPRSTESSVRLSAPGAPPRKAAADGGFGRTKKPSRRR
ncbi:MAG TPA: hypothetical protein VGS00_08435, partial [Thermoanaerobaculia bacterium]|nr:hypothetical protein [Thermoanaerobaculia bacterium]